MAARFFRFEEEKEEEENKEEPRFALPYSMDYNPT